MNVTVTLTLPGFTTRTVLNATLLVTVTVTVTKPPATREPEAGDTVTLVATPAGTVIV